MMLLLPLELIRRILTDSDFRTLRQLACTNQLLQRHRRRYRRNRNLKFKRTHHEIWRIVSHIPDSAVRQSTLVYWMWMKEFQISWINHGVWDKHISILFIERHICIWLYIVCAFERRCKHTWNWWSVCACLIQMGQVSNVGKTGGMFADIRFRRRRP